jgi:CRISPR-associated protein Csh2
MTDVSHRHEILFLYECTDCNPNGDPLDENRPRTDPEMGVATVTDVRIKRTVRDYLLSLEPDVKKRLAAGREILVRDTFKPDGFLSEGKDRAEQFLDEATKKKKSEEKRKAAEDAICEGCIDARLFGAALPLGKNTASVQLTGPVQFSAFNRSLHRVAPTFVQQTAAYAGSAKAEQKSFAERWLLPYALIAAYGVVNEVAAKTTQMSMEDLEVLLEALWRGTANLNTHSKIGHEPLLLIVAEYAPGRRIGALPRLIGIEHELEDTALRSTADYTLDIARLLEALKNCAFLARLRVAQNTRLRCKAIEKEAPFAELADSAALEIETLDL